MARPGVKIEVGRIEREEAMLLDSLLKARQEEGLSLNLSNATQTEARAARNLTNLQAGCRPSSRELESH